MGPAGFLIADDGEIGMRNQAGLAAELPEWLRLARGMETDVTDETGIVNSDKSAETPQRGFYSQWARRRWTGAGEVMTDHRQCRAHRRHAACGLVDPEHRSRSCISRRGWPTRPATREWEALWADDETLYWVPDAPRATTRERNARLHLRQPQTDQKPGSPTQHRQPALPDATVGDAPVALQQRGHRRSWDTGRSPSESNFALFEYRYTQRILGGPSHPSRQADAGRARGWSARPCIWSTPAARSRPWRSLSDAFARPPPSTHYLRGTVLVGDIPTNNARRYPDKPARRRRRLRCARWAQVDERCSAGWRTFLLGRGLLTRRPGAGGSHATAPNGRRSRSAWPRRVWSRCR